MTESTPCATCRKPVDPLERFPGGLCLSCWEVTAEGRRIPTAEELVRMWGGGR